MKKRVWTLKETVPPIDEEGLKDLDSWIPCGNHYKCGNCGKMPYFVDIKDRNKCYHCGRTIKWVKTKDGERIPVKFKFNKQDEAPPSNFELF